MQDRPSARELLEAIEHFLEHDVMPALQGPKQYHARVAANVTRILAREIELGPGFLRAEWRRLAELLEENGTIPAEEVALAQAVRQMNLTLCEKIRRGDADQGQWRDRALAHLRKTVEEKLAIAKPEMLKKTD